MVVMRLLVLYYERRSLEKICQEKIGKNSFLGFFSKKKTRKTILKTFFSKKHKKWEFKNFSTNLLCTSGRTSD